MIRTLLASLVAASVLGAALPAGAQTGDGSLRGYSKDEHYSCGGENDRCRDDRVLQPPGDQAIQKHQHNKSSDNDHDAPMMRMDGNGPPHALRVCALPECLRGVCSRVLVAGDDAQCNESYNV